MRFVKRLFNRGAKEEHNMKVEKSFWDKYAANRRAQISRANLLRQRGIGVRRPTGPARAR